MLEPAYSETFSVGFILTKTKEIKTLLRISLLQLKAMQTGNGVNFNDCDIKVTKTI